MLTNTMHRNTAPESIAIWISFSQLLNFSAINGITEIDATTIKIFNAAKKSKRRLKFIHVVIKTSNKTGDDNDTQALLTYMSK
ncbi:hypothetical protein [Pseudoalteromonas luteoviolacea]|uniref:hypothetical protein n=1 Tax=Pseudoalteromonas luteoviolacea TaxID=43657 RepID=UPI00055BB84A|nr:hypothetical protein [Pseudoalteromonas luteoviolacea]KZN38178.1 hypothetical protein N483_19675 [Pseudoalteromonas luteoviolacea NCIMB 1944]